MKSLHSIKLLSFNLFISLFLFKNNIYALKISLISGDNLSIPTIYSIRDLSEEIMKEALKESKIDYDYVLDSWQSAQNKVLRDKHKNLFIFPLTRNTERENKYKWISKLYTAKLVFVTKNPNEPLNSLANAKNRKIGVLEHSSFKTTLDNASIKTLAEHEILKNFEDLKQEKIYGWYHPLIEIKAIIQAQKENPEDYSFGDKIDAEEIYLATANSTSDDVVIEVTNAIEKFKKTSQYKVLINKHPEMNQ